MTPALAILPVLEPVRKDAIACNGGHASDDDDLIAGVIRIVHGAGWSDADIIENPAGAVSEFRDIAGFRSDVDALENAGPIHGYNY